MLECAVVAAPDPKSGELPAAMLVLNPAARWTATSASSTAASPVREAYWKSKQVRVGQA